MPPKKSERPYNADTSPLMYNSLLDDGLPRDIELSKIIVRPQARKYFDREKHEDLKRSIADKGLLEPILVRPTKKLSIYELVTGERRFRACKDLGLEYIVASVRELTDVEVMEICLVENLIREDLNPYEQTVAIVDLIATKYRISTKEAVTTLYNLGRLTSADRPDSTIGAEDKRELNAIEEIFSKIGLKLSSFTTNQLPLLNMPTDVIEELERGNIAYTKARQIARIKDEAKRSLILETAIAEKWTLRKTQDEVKLILNSDRPVEPKIKTDFKSISSKLTKAVNSKKISNTQSDKLKHYLDSIDELLDEILGD